MFEAPDSPKGLPKISASEFLVVYGLYTAMVQFLASINEENAKDAEDALTTAHNIMKEAPGFMDHAYNLNERVANWLMSSETAGTPTRH